MKFRKKFQIVAITSFAVLVVLLSGIFGWRIFHPRFSLPKDVINTPIEAPLQRKLAAWTTDQGWIQTDAGLRNLNKQSAVGDHLERIRSGLFPNVEFFSVRLRSSHALFLRGVSAPFENLVIAVDGKSGRTWSFHSGEIEKEVIPFLRELDVPIHNEKDALTLWQLCSCLHPVPLTECEVHHTSESRWCVIPKDPGAISLPGLCFDLDPEHYARSIQVLPKGR
jgi:hypothetical protein